jgi:hypothetical protein
MNTRIVSPLVLLTLLYLPASAFAVPITVTDGAVTFGHSNMGQLDLIGQGFRLTAPVIDTSVSACQRCAPGLQTLNAAIAVSDLGFTPTIPMTLNGNPATLNIRPSSFPTDYLRLTGTVFVPEPAGGRTAVSAPFSFTGTLNVLEQPSPINIVGQGTATLRLYESGGEWYRDSEEGLRYAFTASPATVNPEPTSLLLFGSGAVWLFRRRRAAR